MENLANLVLVGGHSRNIGKTSVVSGIIKGLSELNWTAVKITQTGHNICADDGLECGCEVPAHEFILTEEKEKSSRADTTRFLASGARRSLWLRTRQGELVCALSKLRSEIEMDKYIIIESNSLRKFWTPKLYLQVLDPTISDFKLSAQQFFDLADAYIFVEKSEKNLETNTSTLSWKVSTKNLEKPRFIVEATEGFINKTVVDFVRKRLCA